MTSLLAGDWLGVADATVGRGMDWLNESVKHPVEEWAVRNEDLLRDVGHRLLNVGIGVAAGATGVAVCAGTAGMGCAVAASVAVAVGYGTVAHTGLAVATREEITVPKVLTWMRQSVTAGLVNGYSQARAGVGPLRYFFQEIRSRRIG
ncbi:hypothetical protein [Streptomyces sedi]|uniref:Uncharacterized protein n=1 Tax=Streptomyces sedi TaxID=555059 RepID=A0A5C4VET3_9ACTN|nr:hypothetical protein [Streptomyces sedi]TNM34413.1 hypothetical protein FH715_01660 [Streptomyces sedi]